MNLQIIKLFSPLFFILNAFSVSAQYSISGIVSGPDKENALLEGVEISIPLLHRTDVSQAGGTYLFRNTGEGVFVLQFRKAGYKTILRTVEVKDSALVLNVSMDKYAGPVSEIAELADLALLNSESAYSLSTFQGKSLFRRRMPDFVSVLSAEPGIDARGESYSMLRPVLRGLANSRVLYYQHGNLLESHSWNNYIPLELLPADANGLELIKGPAALKLGAGSTGGVLLLREEENPVAGVTEGDVRAGFFSNSSGLALSTALKGSGRNGIFYGFRLGMQSHSSYVEGDDGDIRKNTEDLAFVPNTRYADQNLKAFAGLSRPWGSSRLTFSLLKREAGLLDPSDSLESDLDFNESQRKRKMEEPYSSVNIYHVSSVTTILTGPSNVKVKLYRAENENEMLYANSRMHKVSIGSAGFDLQFNSNPLRSLSYSAGIQGTVREDQNAGNLEIVPESSASVLGAFMQLRYRYNRWDLHGVMRYDTKKTELDTYLGRTDSLDLRASSVRKDYSAFGASAGLVFHAWEKLKFRLNASSVSAAPDSYQLYAYTFNRDSSAFIAGNASLDEERNNSMEAGFLWEASDVSMSGTYFYYNINSFIHSHNTGGMKKVLIAGMDTLIPYHIYVQRDALIQGMEWTLHLHPDGLKWFNADLGYAMQRGTYDDEREMESMPSDKASLQLRFLSDRKNYLHFPFIGIALRHYFRKDAIADQEAENPAITLFDLHLGTQIRWSQQHIDISLVISNLLNENFNAPLSLLRGTSYGDMGRNVALNLIVPFGIRSRQQ